MPRKGTRDRVKTPGLAQVFAERTRLDAYFVRVLFYLY
jgi:hypothetical protein